jgi:hypothetical protein
MLLALALLAHTSFAAVDAPAASAQPGPNPLVLDWSGRSASLVREELAQVKLELENNKPQPVLATLLGTLIGGAGLAGIGGVLIATSNCSNWSCGVGAVVLTGTLIISGALIAIIGLIAGMVMAGSNVSRAAERERLQARQSELQQELDRVDPPWPDPPPPPRTPGGEGAAPGLLTIPL